MKNLILALLCSAAPAAAATPQETVDRLLREQTKTTPKTQAGFDALLGRVMDDREGEAVGRLLTSELRGAPRPFTPKQAAKERLLGRMLFVWNARQVVERGGLLPKLVEPTSGRPLMSAAPEARMTAEPPATYPRPAFGQGFRTRASAPPAPKKSFVDQLASAGATLMSPFQSAVHGVKAGWYTVFGIISDKDGEAYFKFMRAYTLKQMRLGQYARAGLAKWSGKAPEQYERETLAKTYDDVMAGLGPGQQKWVRDYIAEEVLDRRRRQGDKRGDVSEGDRRLVAAELFGASNAAGQYIHRGEEDMLAKKGVRGVAQVVLGAGLGVVDSLPEMAAFGAVMVPVRVAAAARIFQTMERNRLLSSYSTLAWPMVRGAERAMFELPVAKSAVESAYRLGRAAAEKDDVAAVEAFSQLAQDGAFLAQLPQIRAVREQGTLNPKFPRAEAPAAAPEPPATGVAAKAYPSEMKVEAPKKSPKPDPTARVDKFLASMWDKDTLRDSLSNKESGVSSRLEKRRQEAKAWRERQAQKSVRPIPLESIEGFGQESRSRAAAGEAHPLRVEERPDGTKVGVLYRAIGLEHTKPADVPGLIRKIQAQGLESSGRAAFNGDVKALRARMRELTGADMTDPAAAFDLTRDAAVPDPQRNASLSYFMSFTSDPRFAREWKRGNSIIVEVEVPMDRVSVQPDLDSVREALNREPGKYKAVLNGEQSYESEYTWMDTQMKPASIRRIYVPKEVLEGMKAGG